MVHRSKIYKFKIITLICISSLMTVGLAAFALSENAYSLTFNNEQDGKDDKPDDVKLSPTPSVSPANTSTPNSPTPGIGTTQPAKPTGSGSPTSAPTPTKQVSPTATPTPSPSPTPTLTPTPTPTPVPNDLKKDEFPEVNALIEKFYAAKLTCASEDFKGLVNNLDLLPLETWMKQYEYVKSFSNFECYTKTGIGAIEYVVFVVYDTEIATISTLAPSLDRLLLMRDEATGNLVICYNNPSKSTAAYIEELQSHDDVVALFNQVSADLEKALKSDADLNSLFNNLQ